MRSSESKTGFQRNSGLTRQQMETLLEQAEYEGWHSALLRNLKPEVLASALESERASFHQLLQIPDGSRILLLAGGWGGVLSEFARKYQVTVFEPDPGKARFLVLRARQEGYADRLQVIQGELQVLLEKPVTYQVIIASQSEIELTSGILKSLQRLLSSEGLVCLQVQNRISWKGYCSWARFYWDYQVMFRLAGLRARSEYVCPRAGADPSELIPLMDQAIRHYSLGRLELEEGNFLGKLRNEMNKAMSKVFYWKLGGPGFLFVLEKSREVSHA